VSLPLAGAAAATGHATARAEVILSRRAKMLFSQAEFNKLLRTAAFQAGWDWIDKYLPARWNLGYAKGVLGWKPGRRRRAGTGAYAIDQASQGEDTTPFLESGDFLRNAAAARPLATAKAGQISLKIRVPVGHYLNRTTAQAFTRTPPAEARFVGLRVFQHAKQMINEAQGAAKPGAAPGRLKLTGQGAAIAKVAQANGRTAQYRGLAQRRMAFQTRADELVVSDSERRGARAAQLDRWRQASGGAAMQGSQNAPALGRQATARAANARYRHSPRGRATRAAQKRQRRLEQSLERRNASTRAA
jgi:hypothetical protein